MFKYIAIILITVSLFCSCAQQKETTSAIPVILDTDARVVEEARLESVYTPKVYRGFESRSLR